MPRYRGHARAQVGAGAPGRGCKNTVDGAGLAVSVWVWTDFMAWHGVETDDRRVTVVRMADFRASALTHPEAARVYALWDTLRAGQTAPFRAALDAGSIGAAAPFLAILEAVGPSNFRIRIAGDRLNKWFGLELRGMSALAMSVVDGRNHVQSAINRVTREPAFATIHGTARATDGFSAPFTQILLPMRSDFGKIDRVLVGLWLSDAPALLHNPIRLDAREIAIVPIVPHDAPKGELRAAAEDPAPFRRPALRPVEGAGDADKPLQKPRRGHLRLVKKP